MTEEQRGKLRSELDSQTSVLVGDALLYLAPARTLTKSSLSPDLYLDAEFRKENARRAALCDGLPDPTVKDNPVSPQFFHDYGVHSAAAAKRAAAPQLGELLHINPYKRGFGQVRLAWAMPSAGR